MFNISINGKKIKVSENLTILQACNKIGISIPTFCHDERLVPHGACRICVVEVVGARNLLTACSTPVSEGMEVYTHSDEVIKVRREILELILANHPYDCMTCEKAGACKLQDYAYEYNVKDTRFRGEIKEYQIDDSNPFYISDQNKCISCGKCVRVCNELQGTGAIGFKDRGFDTYIGTPFDFKLDDSVCVSCGNCVSVCPVGALIPKSKEKFRQWEIKRVRTTCSYCGVGCQMELLVKENKVVGVEPAKGYVNNGLLCVKGKFGFEFLNSSDRLKKPMVRKNGQLVETSWEEAYQFISDKMIKTINKYGSDSFGGLTSARCTNEENYLFQKLFRGVIKTNNIDHCARL